MTLALIALAALAGLLIGSVAIGGVLLVPLMVLVFGIDIRVAAAAAMFGYVFSGLLALQSYRPETALPRTRVAALLAGAIPGALLGALSVAHINSALLQVCVAGLTIFAGCNALRTRAGVQGQRQWPVAAFGLIGTLTGFGSALTGTGGPLILVPVLLLGALPTAAAIAVGQLVQLPIGLLASVGNHFSGLLDLGLGSAIATGLVAGVFLGNKLRARVDQQWLRKALGFGLVAVGGLMLLQLAVSP
ncbi:MAG: sulfite exporter TauE/SafE family protein [Pseudomonadales bacterium]